MWLVEGEEGDEAESKDTARRRGEHSGYGCGGSAAMAIPAMEWRARESEGEKEKVRGDRWE